MTRYYPNTDIIYRNEVRVAGVLTDATTITFQYKLGKWGAWTSVTPLHPSTGVYTATVTPSYGGALFWQWKTTGPNASEEGMTYVEPSEFDDQSYPYRHYDYGWVR